MRPSSVPTAKIKTNAIWARIIRNCLLSLASRYIPNRFSSRLPYLRPYFSSSNYTLLKRWKNLKSPLKRDRFSSLVLHRCDTLFISLVLFLSRFISRVFDCVSWCLQRYHPYRLVLSFSLPLFLPILPAYKRFDWNRSASRQARKQASKAFQMKVSPVISFSATRIASSLPLSSAFFFAFFCTFTSLSASPLYSASDFDLYYFLMTYAWWRYQK